MKTIPRIAISLAMLTLVVGFTSFTSCTGNAGHPGADRAELDSMRAQIATLTSGNAKIAAHLARFDTLDFTVFSNQQWTRLHESHANDVIVHWPDGHVTVGIERHIADLKAMFVYAPNTSIKEHPIRFGSGNMTCVAGTMTGTFSSPMPTGGNNVIEPTWKTFSLPMCTVGIWDNGVMTEEYLFWDNQSYMTQIGLGK